MKKLTKSSTDKKICGVCAGIANNFGMDVTTTRLIWALASLFTSGLGVVAYVIAAVVMPYDNEEV